MEISAPVWRWGYICAVLILVDNKVLRFSSDLLVACMRLTYSSSTCGPCVFLNLFSHGVSTLVYFLVAFLYTIPYIGLLEVGFPLQLLHSLVLWIKFSDSLVLLLLIKLLFLLVTLY